MKKLPGRGHYRLGDYVINHERWRLWRVQWLPEEQEYRVRAGQLLEGFPTLREARAFVEKEIAADAHQPDFPS